MQTEQRVRVLRQIPRSVWVLGCVSLFMDISSEIIHSLFTPPDLRGTAFGFFNLFSGVVTLVSSVIAGTLWTACVR